MSESERATLECVFFCGLTFAEIATHENVPLATIRLRAARTLALLQGALTPQPTIDGAGAGNAEALIRVWVGDRAGAPDESPRVVVGKSAHT